MRLSSMFLALLVAPLTLAAQQATGNGSPAQTAAPQSAIDPHIIIENSQTALRNQMAALELRYASACPVGFSVNRVAVGAVIRTASPRQRAQHGQGVDITFIKPKTQIASADIVVHGYSAAVHVIPATPSAPAEITETFHLTASADQPLLSPSVWTAHMVAISSVELTHLDYTDGTVWQSSAPRQCSATPSSLVLVDSAH